MPSNQRSFPQWQLAFPWHLQLWNLEEMPSNQRNFLQQLAFLLPWNLEEMPSNQRSFPQRQLEFPWMLLPWNLEEVSSNQRSPPLPRMKCEEKIHYHLQGPCWFFARGKFYFPVDGGNISTQKMEMFSLCANQSNAK